MLKIVPSMNQSIGSEPIQFEHLSSKKQSNNYPIYSKDIFLNISRQIDCRLYFSQMKYQSCQYFAEQNNILSGQSKDNIQQSQTYSFRGNKIHQNKYSELSLALIGKNHEESRKTCSTRTTNEIKVQAEPLINDKSQCINEPSTQTSVNSSSWQCRKDQILQLSQKQIKNNKETKNAKAKHQYNLNHQPNPHPNIYSNLDFNHEINDKKKFKMEAFNLHYESITNFQLFSKRIIKIRNKNQTLAASTSYNSYQQSSSQFLSIFNPEECVNIRMTSQLFQIKENKSPEKSPNLINLNAKMPDFLSLCQTVFNVLNRKSKQLEQTILTKDTFLACQIQESKTIFNQIQHFQLNHETTYLLIQFSFWIYNRMREKMRQRLSLEEKIQFFRVQILNFIEHVCLFNYCILSYEFQTQNSINFKNVLVSHHQSKSLNHQKENLKSQTVNCYQLYSNIQLKVELFWQSYKNSKLLWTIYKKSLSKSDKKLLVQLNKAYHQTTKFNFELLFICIESLESGTQIQTAQSYLNYCIHFSQFVQQIISDLSEGKNSSLQYVYNSIRFIEIFLILNAWSILLRRIQEQILAIHGQLFYSLFQKLKNESSKYKQLTLKISKAKGLSFQKIQKYRKSAQSQQQLKKSANAQKIKKLLQQNYQLMQLISQLDNQNRKNYQNFTWKDTKLLFRYIYKLLSQQYLCETVLKRSFKKMCSKRFKKSINPIQFEDFLKGKEFDLKTEQNADLNMKAAEKDFKIMIIQSIKIYSMVSTLIFYSYGTEIQNERIKKLKEETPKVRQTNPQNFNESLKLLDTFYMHKAQKKLNTEHLLHMKIEEIDQILNIKIKQASLISSFIENYKVENPNAIIEMNQANQSFKQRSQTQKCEKNASTHCEIICIYKDEQSNLVNQSNKGSQLIQLLKCLVVTNEDQSNQYNKLPITINIMNKKYLNDLASLKYKYIDKKGNIIQVGQKKDVKQ